MAEKLVLVPERLLKRTAPEVQSISHPVARQILDLDKEIEELLRRELPEDEKLKRYSTILERYLEYQKQLRAERKQPVAVRLGEGSRESIRPSAGAAESYSRVQDAPSSSTEASATSSARLAVDGVTRSLPKSFRDKGSRLLQHLQHNSDTDISWDNQGRLVIDGQPVLGSNIVDLVYQAVSPQPRKVKDLAGVDSFNHLLDRTNVPASLLSKTSWTQLHRKRPVSPPATPQSKKKTGRKSPVRKQVVQFRDWH